MTDLKVVSIYDENYRNPVSMLRAVADEIEAGDFGGVGTIGVVLLGDTLEVFGGGVEGDTKAVGMLLHAGFLRLSRSIEEHGKP